MQRANIGNQVNTLIGVRDNSRSTWRRFDHRRLLSQKGFRLSRPSPQRICATNPRVQMMLDVISTRTEESKNYEGLEEFAGSSVGLELSSKP